MTDERPPAHFPIRNGFRSVIPESPTLNHPFFSIECVPGHRERNKVDHSNRLPMLFKQATINKTKRSYRSFVSLITAIYET